MIDFGIFPLMQQRDLDKSAQTIVDEAVEQTRVAEEVGFDVAWYPEHHFSNYSLCPSPLMIAAHCAALTKRIRMGSAVIVAPLYSAPRLIAEIGFVDALSNGRLEVGIGTGYQQFEFDRFGVDLEHNREMTIELMEMIELGLGQEHFSYQGKFYNQRKTAISMRPVQKPHPPIWVASAETSVVRHALSRGHNVFISGVLGGWKRLAAMRTAINNVATGLGKDPERIRVGVLRLGFASDNKRDVERYVENARYQQRLAVALKRRQELVVNDYIVQEQPYEDELPFEKMMENLPVGDVETCIERVVNEIRHVRPVHMAIQTQIGNLDRRTLLRSIELWGTRIIPGIRKELGLNFNLAS